MKISVAIISNSAQINDQVIKALDFADEIIIVVDSNTKKPKTIKKVHYYYRPLNHDFSSQRNYALVKAKNDWVLFVDDDEYVGKELKREISALDKNCNLSGYMIRRLDLCFHQILFHGETGNTYLLRLANKKRGEFVRPVHEKWQVNGCIGRLNSPIYHLKDNLVSGFISRMNCYASVDARELTKEGKPFAYWRLLFNPVGKFIFNYFIKLGFLDGTIGLMSAYLMSTQSLTVRIFQWAEKN